MAKRDYYFHTAGVLLELRERFQRRLQMFTWHATADD